MIACPKCSSVNEEWRDIAGYEGIYQVSDYGRIKSLARISKGRWDNVNIKERILKPAKNNRGYYEVSLSLPRKTYKIHSLVWGAFGSEDKTTELNQIDHIDNDKGNNHISNLRLVNNRENCTKRSLLRKKTSRYTGVRLDPRKKKPYWTAQIYVKGSLNFLGGFRCESLAGLAYQKALISIGGL